jgi:transcriptional regulator with XRE-family HTH domain
MTLSEQIVDQVVDGDYDSFGGKPHGPDATVTTFLPMATGPEGGPAVTIAVRLQILFDQAKMNVVDVARAADLDRQAVWKIMRGETKNPGILTVEKLVAAVGFTMLDYYRLREPSMEDFLRYEVRRVLIGATDGKGTEPGFLTSYQILERLRPDLRDKLIETRGGVGAGSGASFSPTRDIGIAIDAMGDEVEKRYIDARGMSFRVADEMVTSGYPLISIYRIKTILVRDLRPSPKDWFARPDAVRIDTEGQWWLNPDAQVRGGFTDDTPIIVLRGDTGFIANRPDTGEWKMHPEVLAEYPGFIKLLYPLGKYQVAAFKPR